MRKMTILTALLLCVVFCMSACDSGSAAQGKDEASVQEERLGRKRENVEKEPLLIEEKAFSNQINYIYNYPKEYLGRTVIYEGMAAAVEEPTLKEMLNIVYRKGPGGCCGNDGQVGFEVVYDGSWPADDEWVKVTGKIDYITHGGVEYLAVYADDIEVMEERGLETVT
jgi:Predicted membrane protein